MEFINVNDYQNVSWIESLAQEEVNMEESGIIRFNDHLNTPQLLEESSFPYDRPIDIWRGRVFLGTLNGIIIRAPGQLRTFGVAATELARLNSVLSLMSQHQKAIRDTDEMERQRALADAEAARQPVYHVVERGEALELIARDYSVTVEQLQEWNGLDSPQIRAGVRLLVKPWT